MIDKEHLKAHACMFTACLMWGLMSPIGKDAMLHGLSGIEMATFRMVGGAVLFWIASLFTKREKVPPRDILKLFGAGMIAILLNQGSFIVGVSYTSPINASIITTLLPIITMLLSAFILHEPITGKKVMGIFCGITGALILILSSAKAANIINGDIRGDLFCLFAQLSFATYLTLFKHFIQKYSAVTLNKWMFLSAAIVILPMTGNQIVHIPFQSIPTRDWLEVGYVVCCSTFLSFLLSMFAQKVLRPTVVSMYNYVQPISATVFSVATGIASFGTRQSVAVVFVFIGVYLVTKSKSRADMLREKSGTAE
jgi:drug/metabolite transporter (DMT)-like permease